MVQSYSEGFPRVKGQPGDERRGVGGGVLGSGGAGDPGSGAGFGLFGLGRADQALGDLAQGGDDFLVLALDQGAAAREQFSPFIRSDLDHEFAFTLLRSAMRTAADPQFCNRLGISRQASVRQAIELWSKGALGDPPR